MTEEPRQAVVLVDYERKINSQQSAGWEEQRPASTIAEYINSFTYTDPASGESDTVSISMNNIDLRWINEWMPQKGDKLTVRIVERSWETAGEEKTFLCGEFCLDDLNYAGPEYTCTIGGVSVPDGNAFRSTDRSKTWKEATLKEIAAEIAEKYHLKLYYSGKVIKLGTVEQSSEADSSFLKKICEEYGMAIKIYCGKIIIYDKGEYESKEPIVTLTADELQSWRYNTTLNGTYTGANIRYTSGSEDKELKCTVGNGKRILTINEKVETLQEAQLKACARVNAENEKATTMNVTIMAKNKIVAGSTVKIEGLFQISGIYFVDKVTHNIGADKVYTMDLELHRCQKRIGNLLENTSSEVFAIGDKVIVNGPAYWGGNGGRANQCKNMTMYITQILGSGYKYQYGVAKRKGWDRYGWCEKGSLKKI